eukprot:725359-Amphidinium_carterae.1
MPLISQGKRRAVFCDAYRYGFAFLYNPHWSESKHMTRIQQSQKTERPGAHRRGCCCILLQSSHHAVMLKTLQQRKVKLAP